MTEMNFISILDLKQNSPDNINKFFLFKLVYFL